MDKMLHSFCFYFKLIAKFVALFGNLVLDASSMCYIYIFPRANVKHVYREANKVAYKLVKFALRIDDEFIWLEEIPHPIWHVC